MINILFAATDKNWDSFQAPLRRALQGLDYHLARDIAPDQVDYIIYAPSSPLQDFSPYTRLKAVLSLWVGVERIVGNDTLKVPLARMVDDVGVTQGMKEWVCGHVLRHHLGMDRHIVNPDHDWVPEAPPLASQRPVTVLGPGALGQACGQALASLGFPVTGWSRSAKDVPGLTCLHGDDGLKQALADAQILVLLLPNTPATANMLNARTLAMLPRGACVINPGRGTLIDDDALIAALDAGRVAQATLDVFRTEPLPSGHPFWAHPQVTVTPHIAAETRPESAADVIAENIRRNEAGAPLLHLVDRDAGY
jgi:glyoxylate/hydroxypyruvate reductase A